MRDKWIEYLHQQRDKTLTLTISEMEKLKVWAENTTVTKRELKNRISQ